MQNYRQPGDIITLTAPGGGVTVDLGYLIGSIFVVATATVAAGLEFEGRVTGVLELVKDAGTAWTEGELIYWDDSANNCVDASGSTAGKLLIGVAAASALSGALVGEVRLNGSGRPLGVSDNELDDDAVDTAAIQDLAVTTAKIAAVAVTTAKIALDAIDGTLLADNAIDSEHYTDGSIDQEHHAVGSGMIWGEDLSTPDLLDDDRFLLSVVMQATAYTLDETTLPAGNPPRNVIITHTTDTTTDTLGDAVVVGTDVDDGAITETLTIAADGVVTGAKAFKTVTSVTSASWVQGGGVSDLIEVGFGNLLGLSKVRAAAGEVFLGFLAGVARLPDAVAVDAANVEGNTVSLTGGTYDGSKTAKALILL